jgi:O-antigen ligase
VFPVLQLIYMFFNYVVFYSIIEARKIYELFNRLVKLMVWIGTGIAIYSLFAMFVVDVVAKLPEFLQNKKEFLMRSTGLSQEPSFYVLYQTWLVLFVFYSKNLFNKWTWFLLLGLNIISLVFTFSTTLVALILIIGLSFFILKNPLKIKLLLLGGIAVSTLVVYVILLNSSNWDYIETFFINKLTNFFSSPDHTLDSGSFRSFTTRIGFAIFGQYPLFGVGVGNSIYYMYQFENKMGIIVFGERLFAGSFPQNAFSIVLSEQGIFGVLFFMLLLGKMFVEFWKFRNYDNYSRMFFIGFLFNVAALMTIAPIYSLFIWVFPALGIGYINHKIKYEHAVES